MTQPVTSPTYTIGHRYEGRVAVSHLDLYRFERCREADWGALEPYFDDAIVLRRVAGGGRRRRCPRRALRVRLRHVDERRRLIVLEGDADLGV